MLLGQEKKAIKQIINHIHQVEQCLTTARQAVEDYFTDDVEAAFVLIKQIHAREQKAGDVQHEIMAELYGGAFLPIIREDIYNIVKCLGNLASRADFFGNFLFYNKPAIPPDLKKPFKKVAEKTFDIIDPVKDGVLGYFDGYGNLNTVQNMAGNLETLGVKIAVMKCELTSLILSADYDPGRKILLKECLEGIGKIFTAAGKTADKMECITLKTGF
ncbi:MAG: hypothetical protein B6I22_02730 [Desulfobacteraceae bacterium 4572_123]|nr:MAG: hypothetical protein B6I22_02730 [Desulfobacteraceae bacterium 4572_123]